MSKKWSYLKIVGDGEKVTYHETGRDVFDNIKIEQGDFDTANEKIRELSGKQNYNLKMLIFFDKDVPFIKCGVMSDDRERMYLADSTALFTTRWIVSQG